MQNKKIPPIDFSKEKVEHFEFVQEPRVLASGRPHVALVKKVFDPDTVASGRIASDFSITSIVAAGATDLLSPVMLSAGSSLRVADQLYCSLENLSNKVNQPENNG